MLRKIILALTATAAIGVAALAPTSASAFPFKGPHGHWHFGHGHFGGWYGGGYGGDGCYVVGPRWRRFIVCD